MAKLTVLQLKALRPEDAGKRIRDDGGLIGTVRNRANGVSVYFDWRYRFAGKVHQIACGSYPRDSLPEIRAFRDQARSILSECKNPATEFKAKRLKIQADQAEAVNVERNRLDAVTAAQARMTVKDLFVRWSEIELIRRKDKGKEVSRMFNKDVLPRIGELFVEDVRKGHITAVTDALLARGVPRMAKLIFSLMRQMFRFAVDRDIIESDPSAAIRKAKIGGKDIERERVLSDGEINELIAKLPNAHLLPSTEVAIWLCLATCCRIGELLRASWSDIDFTARKWQIPTENAKNGITHTVYLSDFALAKFLELKAINEAIEATKGKTKPSPWCYSNRSRNNSVCVKTITKQIGDRQRGEMEILSRRSPHKNSLTLSGGKWSPHDLRRTGATMMQPLGVLPEVADRCLNHLQQNKVRRIYLRHNYEKEKREAWYLLGERLELLTTGASDKVSNVHQLFG